MQRLSCCKNSIGGCKKKETKNVNKPNENFFFRQNDVYRVRVWLGMDFSTRWLPKREFLANIDKNASLIPKIYNYRLKQKKKKTWSGLSLGKDFKNVNFFINLKHINKWQLKDFKIIFHKWSNHSNGRKVTKTPVNLYNPTLLLSGSCMVRDIIIHWKSSLWPYLAVLLVKSLICTIYNFCWSWFKKRFIVDSSRHCESGQLETVTHILRDYVLYPT